MSNERSEFEKKLSKTNNELYPDRPGVEGLHNQSSCLNYALSMAVYDKKQREKKDGTK